MNESFQHFSNGQHSILHFLKGIGQFFIGATKLLILDSIENLLLLIKKEIIIPLQNGQFSKGISGIIPIAVIILFTFYGVVGLYKDTVLIVLKIKNHLYPVPIVKEIISTEEQTERDFIKVKDQIANFSIALNNKDCDKIRDVYISGSISNIQDILYKYDHPVSCKTLFEDKKITYIPIKYTVEEIGESRNKIHQRNTTALKIIEERYKPIQLKLVEINLVGDYSDNPIINKIKDIQPIECINL